MLTQVLLVPDFEPGIVHLRDQMTGILEFAVREDIPVDKPVGNPARPAVVWPGDAVVQQPAALVELAVKEAEIPRKLGPADVLCQPDRTDRVEPALADIAVVEVPDLSEILKARLLDGALRPDCLLLGQRDAERANPVLARRVHDH